jgi:phenylpropionate dioxygenase-like ring-hydroxylating dioxygenase large terminal subunit
MPFLQNTWYAAAWSYEMQGFLTRTLLDIPVLLFRDSSGGAVAFHDQCPHRFAPLSKGSLVADRIRCIYHGLEFGLDGRCVGNSLNYTAPPAARVRTFPVAEQDNIVWIWFGDKTPTDPAALQRFPFHLDNENSALYGATLAQADYRLFSDNLMDLTHIHLLHPGFGAQKFPAAFRCYEEGDSIVSHYLADDPEAPSIEENVIRWTAPGIHRLDTFSTPAGRERTLVSSAHLLTPETPTSTHYFWSSGIPPGSTAQAAQALLEQVFNKEDKPMLEAIQRRMSGRDFWSMKPLLLQNDLASVKVRKRLMAMIEAEQGGESPRKSG